jgi:hypothetical protein
MVPVSLQKLTIDPKRHAAEVQELTAKSSEVGELVQFSSVQFSLVYVALRNFDC